VVLTVVKSTAVCRRPAAVLLARRPGDPGTRREEQDRHHDDATWAAHQRDVRQAEDAPALFDLLGCSYSQWPMTKHSAGFWPGRDARVCACSVYP